MKELRPLFLRDRQELEHFVVTHRVQGRSIRALARSLGVSRNMIRRILRKNSVQRDQGHDALPKPSTPRASKLDPFRDRMQGLLEKYPRITGQRMFEELREEGYTGGKTIVRDRLRTLRPRPKREPIVRFETSAGEHYGENAIMVRE